MKKISRLFSKTSISDSRKNFNQIAEVFHSFEFLSAPANTLLPDAADLVFSSLLLVRSLSMTDNNEQR